MDVCRCMWLHIIIIIIIIISSSSSSSIYVIIIVIIIIIISSSSSSSSSIIQVTDDVSLIESHSLALPGYPSLTLRGQLVVHVQVVLRFV